MSGVARSWNPGLRKKKETEGGRPIWSVGIW